MSGLGKLDGDYGYDANEIEQIKAQESTQSNNSEFEEEDVDPIYIPVIEGVEAVRTEEYEARVVIIEYDAFDNIIGVELL